ncbi:TonB-dependent receptor [uncultured Polaribacter sp.]|uniref:TonB-dependent receptor domain-containing protein n=1 Tax=uncultured Polaribacter sp. TaxID=174711 RepID=UPI00260FDF60|nr:TonB-dependent receptor [uncultured Polaribacter sp.]
MKKYVLFFLVIGTYTCNVFGQKDSLATLLKEVIVVADKSFKKNSKSSKVVALKDSVLFKNTESFASLLRFNAPIYIREFGAGGTSSASFRGTSSSNTAVIWNGININSINNGQTGFNSLTVSLFDDINIRSGGGSLEYGSGAIGGTVHLNDTFVFKDAETIENQFIVSAGSYNTSNNLYKFKYFSNNLAVKFGVSYNASDNDYPLLGTNLNNENGAYKNVSFNGGFSHKITKCSELNLYSTTYLGERLFSGELPNPLVANDKYKDFNHRNLITYSIAKNNYTNQVNIAYLTEEYRFFDDKNSENFNFGSSERYLVSNRFGYDFKNINATISSFTEYESIFGKTDQISEKNRRQFSQSILFNQHINNLFFYDVKIRKDFNSDYKVPFTYAVGTKLKAFKHLSFRANASKNFRAPTYNDLFWPGQGNLSLKPETALQGEFGIVYANKNFKIDVAGFYISAKDKIVWSPNGDPQRAGIWTPINLSDSKNKGVEALLEYATNIGAHTLQINANYSYTHAKNTETDTFLIFVPKHLFNGSVGYQYKKISAFYQQLYTGATFTTESNSPDFVIPSFFVGNVGVDYLFLKTAQTKLSLGVKINNVLNQLYFTQPRRPLPNRNFNLNINYKF